MENSCYCPTCQGFRSGVLEYVTSSGRKIHYRFLCGWCLIPSDGYFILKKNIKNGKSKSNDPPSGN